MENNTQLQSNNSPITSEITERLNKFFTNETKIKDFIQILRECCTSFSISPRYT